MTSIHKNESQLTTIPQSSAIKLNGKLILLFAKRFIVMTETIKSVIVSEGILLSNTLTSLTSVLILFKDGWEAKHLCSSHISLICF